MNNIDSVLKSYREYVGLKTIINNQNHKSKMLIALNQIPIMAFQKEPVNYYNEKVKSVSYKTISEYLKKYTDLNCFLKDEATESSKEEKQELFDAVSDVYDMSCKNKCLYDLKKLYDDKEFNAPYMKDTMHYAFGYIYQLFKDDLTLIFKSSFDKKDYTYLYPIEHEMVLSAVNVDADTSSVRRIYYATNPNIIGLKKILREVYDNSLLSKIESYDNAELELIDNGSNKTRIPLISGLSINTKLFETCAKNCKICPNPEFYSINGITEQDYKTFLTHLTLANLEVSEYYYRKHYRPKKFLYTLGNMPEFVPVIYNINTLPNILCIPLNASSNKTLLSLANNNLPYKMVGSDIIRLILEEPLKLDVANHSQNYGDNYFLTRKEVYKLSGYAYTYFSVRLNAQKLYPVLIKIAEKDNEQFSEEIKTLREVLSELSTVTANFNRNYSEFTIGRLSETEQENKNIIRNTANKASLSSDIRNSVRGLSLNYNDFSSLQLCKYMGKIENYKIETQDLLERQILDIILENKVLDLKRLHTITNDIDSILQEVFYDFKDVTCELEESK